MHTISGRIYVDPSVVIKNLLRGDSVLVEGKICDLNSMGNWRLNYIVELVKTRSIRTVTMTEKLPGRPKRSAVAK